MVSSELLLFVLQDHTLETGGSVKYILNSAYRRILVLRVLYGTPSLLLASLHTRKSNRHSRVHT